MRNYLTQYALDNIWCDPTQDRQYIIKPARWTPNGGALVDAAVGWVRIPLPVQTKGSGARFFHVYQIGQMTPELLNISTTFSQWFSAETLMETYGVLIDVFLLNGTKVPPAYVWLYVNRDKNVLMAIENVPGMDLGTIQDTTNRKATLDLDDIYVRFYSNEYFFTAAYASRNSTLPPLNVVSQKVTDSNSFNAFWTQCTLVNNQYDPLGLGVSRYYVDGFEYARPMAYDPTRHYNKMLTMIRDTAISQVVDFGVVQDLLTFNSTLDARSKFILLGDTTQPQINYVDDIDFVFTKDNTTQRTVRVPVTSGTEFRQLLHCAWSMDAALPGAIANDHPSVWSGSNPIRVRAYVRTGGMRFGLINDASRLVELMKMSRSDIMGAMSGVSALLDAWRADNLESSAYTHIMRMSMEEIDANLTIVADAFGYNAASRLMSDPAKSITIQNGQLVVDTPPAARMAVSDNGTPERAIFSYDTNGHLVQQFNNLGNYDQLVLPGVAGSAQVKAEVFPMLMSTTTDGCFFNQSVTTKHLAAYGFRCYVCALVAGVPNEVWTDITDTGAGVYYTYDPVGNTGNGFKPNVTWNLTALTAENLYPCVKVGGVVYMYEPDLSAVNYPGILRFSINTQQPGFGGLNPVRIQKLQPAQLDIFMDGECLIEGIDYYVAWPEICIVRKPARTPAEGLRVYARLHGFCHSSTMDRFGPRETGFVKGGILSVDGQFEVRNDRALRVLVGGGFMLRTEVEFVEDGTGTLVTDGKPYAIYDYQMPVEGYTGKSTVPFQATAIAIDATIAGYLDIRKPQNTPANPMIVGDRWQLVSPFFSAIIHAFQYGFLGAGQLDAPYTSVDISSWITPYAYLLNYDPCVQGANTDYVEILPHQYATPMAVTAEQFDFLHKINLQFLGGKVVMSPRIIIGA